MVHLEDRKAKPQERAWHKAAPVPAPTGRAGVVTHREGKWALLAGDMAALIAPLAIATAQRHIERPIALTVSEISTIVFSAVLWSIFAMGANLYSLARASSLAKTHRATIASILLVLAARPLYAPRGNSGDLLTEGRYALFAIILVAVWRTLFAFGTKLIPFTKRVVAIGAGVSGALVAEEMYARARRNERDYQLVGFVDDEFVGWWLLEPAGWADGDLVAGEAELGYRLLRRHWGRGLASEGSRELLRHAFEDLELHRVFALTMAVNERSRATMASAGLRYLRTFHDHGLEGPAGIEEGGVEYAITRDEWRSARAAPGAAT